MSPARPKHFMALIRRGAWLLALVSLPLAALAEKTPPGPPWDDPPPELWFPVGEAIDYEVFWGVFMVGEATAQAQWREQDGRRLLALTVDAQSNGIVEKLYPVKEHLETLLDPVTFLPISFEKESQEGRRYYHESPRLTTPRGRDIGARCAPARKRNLPSRTTPATCSG